jgi:hypothetical protein
MKKICTVIAAAFAIATLGAGAAMAEPGRQFVSAEFRYDLGKSVSANYAAFERKAMRACSSMSRRPLALSLHEKACAADLMDKVAHRMNRADLASVHYSHTGRVGDVFAAR